MGAEGVKKMLETSGLGGDGKKKKPPRIIRRRKRMVRKQSRLINMG